MPATIFVRIRHSSSCFMAARKPRQATTLEQAGRLLPTVMALPS
jgi:hypothetical protein